MRALTAVLNGCLTLRYRTSYQYIAASPKTRRATYLVVLALLHLLVPM